MAPQIRTSTPNSARVRAMPAGCASASVTSLRSSSAWPLMRTTVSRAATSKSGETRPWQLGIPISTPGTNASSVPDCRDGQKAVKALEIAAPRQVECCCRRSNRCKTPHGKRSGNGKAQACPGGSTGPMLWPRAPALSFVAGVQSGHQPGRAGRPCFGASQRAGPRSSQRPAHTV